MNELTIHKYEIKDTITEILVHDKAEILSVGAQGRHAVLWLRESLEGAKAKRRFRAVPTGRTCEASDKFIGTVQFDNGIVVHVFEIKQELDKMESDQENPTVSNPLEAVAILRDVVKAKPEIRYFRSGGFLNKDYDNG